MSLRILLFTCIAALLPHTAFAQPRATAFDIGAQVGISDWSLKGEDFVGEDFEDNYTGATFGGVMRYTVWPGESGLFVGLHTAFMSQQGEYKSIFDEGVLFGTPVELEESVSWSSDFLVRAGYGSDQVGVYVGGGLSTARGKVKFDAEGVGEAEDSHWHLGWKAMTGLDYSVSENWVFNVQVEYASYRNREYNFDEGRLDNGETVDIADSLGLSTLSTKGKADALTARVGLLYRF